MRLLRVFFARSDVIRWQGREAAAAWGRHGAVGGCINLSSMRAREFRGTGRPGEPIANVPGSSPASPALAGFSCPCLALSTVICFLQEMPRVTGKGQPPQPRLDA